MSFWREGWARIALVRLRSWADHMHGSFFFIPALCVVASIVLAEALLAIDFRLGAGSLPPFFQTTVSSARALLGTIAGATITVTGLVFSLVVVALQLASSQYSPRVLRLFFRGRFEQTVMGIMVGTFTYCLVVLHVTRSPTGNNGEEVISGLAVVGALVLAICSTLAILAYVNHIARAMRISEIIQRVSEETTSTIQLVTASVAKDTTERCERLDFPDVPGKDCQIIRAAKAGWVQQAPSSALLAALPANSALRLEVRVGLYVTRETPLCAISPMPPHPAMVERLVRMAIAIGSTRTMQADIEFGLWQLNDIALRALSPAVNVPNSAREVIAHLGKVGDVLLRRELPPTCVAEDGRRLFRARELTRPEYFVLAFAQIRQLAAAQTPVALDLLRTLRMLADEARATGAHDCAATLEEQARLLIKTARVVSPLPEDLQRIHDTARELGLLSEGEAHNREVSHP